MFDDDQLTTSAELRELGDSLTGVGLPARPPLETIRVRGRAHRRRRTSEVAGLWVTVAAAAAALAVVVAGWPGSAPGHGTTATATPGSSRTGTPGTIRTASYTLVSDTTGTVKLTINPRKLFHAAALQRDLARFGIPSKVTAGSFCTSDPAPAGLSQVVSMATGERQTLTFDPAAIPAGAKLSFGNLRLVFGQAAYVALIHKHAFTCTTSPPPSRPVAGGRVAYYLVP